MTLIEMERPLSPEFTQSNPVEIIGQASGVQFIDDENGLYVAFRTTRQSGDEDLANQALDYVLTPLPIEGDYEGGESLIAESGTLEEAVYKMHGVVGSTRARIMLRCNGDGEGIVLKRVVEEDRTYMVYANIGDNEISIIRDGISTESATKSKSTLRTRAFMAEEVGFFELQAEDGVQIVLGEDREELPVVVAQPTKTEQAYAELESVIETPVVMQKGIFAAAKTRLHERFNRHRVQMGAAVAAVACASLVSVAPNGTVEATPRHIDSSSVEVVQTDNANSSSPIVEGGKHKREVTEGKHRKDIETTAVSMEVQVNPGDGITDVIQEVVESQAGKHIGPTRAAQIYAKLFPKNSTDVPKVFADNDIYKMPDGTFGIASPEKSSILKGFARAILRQS